MKRLIGIAILLLYGALVMVPERQFRQELIRKELLDDYPQLTVKEQLGQQGVIGLLGGYRPLVATLYYLSANTAFQNTEWGLVDSRFNLVNIMQPKVLSYWVLHGWHMAWNAASNARYNTEETEAVKQRQYQNYVARGIEILQNATRYVGNTWEIWKELGEAYRQRQENIRLAANAYAEACKRNPPPFIERIYAYLLTSLNDPASNSLAYEILKRHYDLGDHLPSLLRDLPILEERLNIPAEQRIPPPPKETLSPSEVRPSGN